MVHPFMIQFRSPCSEMAGGSQEGSGPLNFLVTLSRSDWGNYLFIKRSYKEKELKDRVKKPPSPTSKP